jgi:hypothetical protein
MKFRPVGTELFHADGQTVVTNFIVAFLNFANAFKNSTLCPNVAFMSFLQFSVHAGKLSQSSEVLMYVALNCIANH